MALIIGFTSTGVGLRYDLTTFDDIHVLAGANIVSTDETAIQGTGSGHSANVLGSVHGAFFGVRLGDDASADSAQYCWVAAGASVSAGVTAGNVGVWLQGHGDTLINDGTITGYNAVAIGASGSGTSIVTNRGVIHGVDDGITRTGSDTERLTIDNRGALVGQVTAFNSNSSNAEETIINRGEIVGQLFMGSLVDTVDNRGGLIDGDILLGDDNDLFDNLGGVVNGTVSGEAGNDTFRLGAGIEFIDGGADVDAIDFRGTPAVEVSLDGSVEGTGNAAGDDYTGVENIYGSYYADLLVGGVGVNTLRGYGGNDVMNGGLGGDKLVGGNGVDTITGGAGVDTFVYDKLSEIGDLITDFNGAGDLFNIRASAFGGGLVAGTLGATLFQSRADNLAQDGDDRFIFRTTDRTLWFDVDGTGANAAVMVADLQAGATVAATNITII